ncbi:MAG: EAL domain-containing protein [Photobacterium frigidiphilum]|uniref:EAL domain-containing protein n=1 Tax=Photobacterium frigidiphilum TaxID=264736 RepID=UPI003002070C
MHRTTTPFNYLKIEGIFIENIDTNKMSRMMVEPITAIAKEMGIKVIAECIETEEELRVIREIGVDYTQGFYLHKPHPITD